MTDDTNPAAGGLSGHQKALRDLWRDLAEKGIEHGADWPYIAHTLFGDIDRLAARTEAAERKLARVIANVETEFGSECLRLRVGESCDCQHGGLKRRDWCDACCLRAALSSADVALSKGHSDTALDDLLDRERAKAAIRAYDDGYNDAVTMARIYGHTDHWPAEGEPRNPYRAAAASPEGGGA